jgi:hypothetical protein
MEYIYPDYDAAEEDMARWEIPPTGLREFGNQVIRSAIVTAKDFDVDGQVLDELVEKVKSKR